MEFCIAGSGSSGPVNLETDLFDDALRGTDENATVVDEDYYDDNRRIKFLQDASREEREFDKLVRSGEIQTNENLFTIS